MSHHRLQRRAPSRALAAALCVLCTGAFACGDEGMPDDEPDASPEPDAALSGWISVPSTVGDMELPFGINVTGAGSSRVDSISVLNAGGQFQILDRTTDGAVYQRIEWPEVNRDLYQTLAVTTDAIYVLWFYCAGSQLEELWVEGTDGTRLAWEPATGSCTYSAEPSSRLIELPAIEMPWPEDPSGFQLDGELLQLDGARPGRVTIDGVEMMLLPFERVNCASCPPMGWYELHALLWDEAAQRLCFGIFYLWRDNPGTIDFAYGFCLPDLQPLETTTFAATWTAG